MLVSFGINGAMDSLEGMWYALIPASLLNQNFSVCKALLTDYYEAAGAPKSELAGAIGMMGLAVGLSFLAGPLLATALISSYLEALALGAAIASLSGVILLFLPRPPAPTPSAAEASGSGSSVLSFISMPVLKQRGAQLLMVMRLLMAFAFHIWAPVWQVIARAWREEPRARGGEACTCVHTHGDMRHGAWGHEAWRHEAWCMGTLCIGPGDLRHGVWGHEAWGTGTCTCTWAHGHMGTWGWAVRPRNTAVEARTNSSTAGRSRSRTASTLPRATTPNSWG